MNLATIVSSAILARIQEATSAAATSGESPTTPPEAPTATWVDTLISFAPMIAIFAIFYFVLIRPERAQRKKREEMLSKMSKGDKVMTTGGMFGTIAALSDKEVTLEIADGVRVKFVRQSIQEVRNEP
ncbi:MAG: preprotein translocase subunit YajC [Planctomycetes bacterium]|nr:preprotein translocase subunit YajC [Planctomycetota bacterium]